MRSRLRDPQIMLPSGVRYPWNQAPCNCDAAAQNGREVNVDGVERRLMTLWPTEPLHLA